LHPPVNRTILKASAAASSTSPAGTLYVWNITAAAAAAAAPQEEDGAPAAAALVLLFSGAKPCSGFRVWVQHHLQQQQQGDVLDSNSSSSSIKRVWLDVTATAAALPTVQDELVVPVRLAE
jgi:hypothetical protein